MASPSPILPVILILCIATHLPASISTVNHDHDHLLSPSTFLTDYQSMLSNFRIFPYTLPNNLTATSLFHSSLLSSRFVTADPTSAHLFYLPTPPDLPTRPLQRVLSHLRSSLPFWNRSLAADHFFLSPSAPSSSARNSVELRKNAVRLSPSFPSPPRSFVPHKDISLPPQTRSDQNSTAELLIGSTGQFRFCVFRYGAEEVVGLGEALAGGCVPVVVAERPVQDMPLMDVLRWQEIALFVGSGVGPAGMKRALNDVVVGGRYERMKKSGVAAAHHLAWNDPPKPYDAFHMVMYQLWLRRHAVRYATSDIM